MSFSKIQWSRKKSIYNQKVIPPWDITRVAYPQHQELAVFGFCRTYMKDNHYLMLLATSYLRNKEHFEIFSQHNTEEVILDATCRQAFKQESSGIYLSSIISTYYFINKKFDYYQWMFNFVKADVFHLVVQKVVTPSTSWSECTTVCHFDHALEKPNKSKECQVEVRINTINNRLTVKIIDERGVHCVNCTLKIHENYHLFLVLNTAGELIKLQGFLAWSRSKKITCP